MPAWYPPSALHATPARWPISSNFRFPRLWNKIIGRHVVGHEQVDPPVVVEIGGDHAEAAAVAIDDPGSPR